MVKQYTRTAAQHRREHMATVTPGKLAGIPVWTVSCSCGFRGEAWTDPETPRKEHGRHVRDEL